MTTRGSDRGAGGGMPVGYSWISSVVLVVAVPMVAFLWWALAFLPWTQSRLPLKFASWPPSLPAVFTDLDVAVFGPLGGALVVVLVLRRTELAFLSILIGLGVSTWVTLVRGADIHGTVTNNSERYVMLAVCLVAAFLGLAMGTAAIRSLRALGFLGLLAVVPVASLVATVLLKPGADESWLIRAALVVLLLMHAWPRWHGVPRWQGVSVWPIFFVLFWLLTLLRSALGYGAATLGRPGAAQSTVGAVADAMVDFIRSGWSVVLADSWRIFWPAALIAALLLAGWYAWGRLRQADTVPSGGRRPR